MRISYVKNTAAAAFMLLILCVYFGNLEEVMTFVKEAMNMCYTTVIPSLFIFMVLASFLSCLKYSYILCLPFFPAFRLLKIKDKRLITYIVLGIIGGFACGGYFLDKIRNEYKCSNNLAGIISILISNNSPAFVISAVGISMLGNTYSGIALYFSLLFSGFITAFILSFLFRYDTAVPTKATSHTASDIIDSITAATHSMVVICGVVIFSYSMCKAISLYTNNPFILLALSGISEVTTGCKFAIELFGKNLIIVCAVLAFCPLSTFLQIKSFGDNKHFSFKILWISKLIHIPLSCIILRVATNLFPQAFAVISGSDISVSMHWYSLRVSCMLLVVAICFVLCFDKKIGVFTNLKK